MQNIILVILCTLAVCLLAFAAYVYFSAKKKSEGINIHVDSNSEVKIIHNDTGMRLDIVYETSEEAHPSYDIFPDIVESVDNDAVNTDAPSIGFWLDVACLNELDGTRREEVVMKLQKMGIIKEEDAKHFLYPETEEPLVPEFPEDELYYEDSGEQDPSIPESAEAEPETHEDNSDRSISVKEEKTEGFKFNEFKL